MKYIIYRFKKIFKIFLIFYLKNQILESSKDTINKNYQFSKNNFFKVIYLKSELFLPIHL
jgi:hypothetical protein